MDYTIFIKSYKTANNKEDIVKKHITKTYLGYAEKMAIARNVANVSSHVIDENGKAGEYKRDTMAQYFHTQMNIIAQYTDIEIPSEVIVNAYDALSECGVLNDIFCAIPEAEIKMVNSMVQMAMDDTYINEQDLSVILSAKVEAVRLSIDTALAALQEISEKVENPITKIVKKN